MPTLSWDQIAETEMTIGDLLEQLEQQTDRADKAEAALRAFKAAYPEIP